jgi:hypothetical protein
MVRSCAGLIRWSIPHPICCELLPSRAAHIRVTASGRKCESTLFSTMKNGPSPRGTNGFTFEEILRPTRQVSRAGPFYPLPLPHE